MIHKPKGRLEAHMKEAGGFDRHAVEERAAELALIEGRPDGIPTEEDRVRATRELLNTHLISSNDPAAVPPMSVEEGTHLATATGRKIPTFKPDDPQRLAELETRKGVREAEHDTMLTERRNREP